MAPPRNKPPVVQSRPVQHLHPQAPPASPAPAQRANGSGWWWFGGLVLAIIGVRSCSTSMPSGGTSQSASAATAQQAIATAITAQTPPPIETLSRASIRRGAAILKIATAAEGLGGEMIYSQNCYDAISRHFSWSKLDVCGAFDAAAVRDLGDKEDAGLAKEIAWFDSEAASGRYLKAAIAAGEDADEADQRLSKLQADIGGASHAATSQTSAPIDVDGELGRGNTTLPVGMNVAETAGPI